MKIINAILTVANTVALSLVLIGGYVAYNKVSDALKQVDEAKAYVASVREKVDNATAKALDSVKKVEGIQAALSKLKLGDAGPEGGTTDE